MKNLVYMSSIGRTLHAAFFLPFFLTSQFCWKWSQKGSLGVYTILDYFEPFLKVKKKKVKKKQHEVCALYYLHALPTLHKVSCEGEI